MEFSTIWFLVYMNYVLENVTARCTVTLNPPVGQSQAVSGYENHYVDVRSVPPTYVNQMNTYGNHITQPAAPVYMAQNGQPTATYVPTPVYHTNQGLAYSNQNSQTAAPNGPTITNPSSTAPNAYLPAGSLYTNHANINSNQVPQHAAPDHMTQNGLTNHKSVTPVTYLPSPVIHSNHVNGYATQMTHSAAPGYYWAQNHSTSVPTVPYLTAPAVYKHQANGYINEIGQLENRGRPAQNLPVPHNSMIPVTYHHTPVADSNQIKSCNNHIVHSAVLKRAQDGQTSQEPLATPVPPVYLTTPVVHTYNLGLVGPIITNIHNPIIQVPASSGQATISYVPVVEYATKTQATYVSTDLESSDATTTTTLRTDTSNINHLPELTETQASIDKPVPTDNKQLSEVSKEGNSMTLKNINLHATNADEYKVITRPIEKVEEQDQKTAVKTETDTAKQNDDSVASIDVYIHAEKKSKDSKSTVGTSNGIVRSEEQIHDINKLTNPNKSHAEDTEHTNTADTINKTIIENTEKESEILAENRSKYNKTINSDALNETEDKEKDAILDMTLHVERKRKNNTSSRHTTSFAEEKNTNETEGTVQQQNSEVENSDDITSKEAYVEIIQEKNLNSKILH